MRIANQRRYALVIAATGQLVNPGDDVEVEGQLAKSLCEQPANWAKKSSTKKSKED